MRASHVRLRGRTSLVPAGVAVLPYPGDGGRQERLGRQLPLLDGTRRAAVGVPIMSTRPAAAGSGSPFGSIWALLARHRSIWVCIGMDWTRAGRNQIGPSLDASRPEPNRFQPGRDQVGTKSGPAWMRPGQNQIGGSLDASRPEPTRSQPGCVPARTKSVAAWTRPGRRKQPAHTC